VIHIDCESEPNRLEQVLSLALPSVQNQGPLPHSPPWSLRIDKDESSIFNISTLRSNLLSLFSSSHRVMSYREKVGRSVSEGMGARIGMGGSDAMGEEALGGNPRMRGLIVDLIHPRFHPPPSLSIHPSALSSTSSLPVYYPFSPHMQLLYYLYAPSKIDPPLSYRNYELCLIALYMHGQTANNSSRNPSHNLKNLPRVAISADGELLIGPLEDEGGDNGMSFASNSVRTNIFAENRSAPQQQLQKRTAAHPHHNTKFPLTLKILPGCNPLVLFEEYKTLNQGQREALDRVLRTRDYSLVLGLPGTGEHHSFSFLCLREESQHKRTSFTHKLIDHIPPSIQN